VVAITHQPLRAPATAKPALFARFGQLFGLGKRKETTAPSASIPATAFSRCPAEAAAADVTTADATSSAAHKEVSASGRDAKPKPTSTTRAPPSTPAKGSRVTRYTVTATSTGEVKFTPTPAAKSTAGRKSTPASEDTKPYKHEKGTTEADRACLEEVQRSATELWRDNDQLQYMMMRIDAHDRTLHTLVSKVKECPTLYWFYPKKPELRAWLFDPLRCLFQDSLMMLVVCPVTLCVVPCGPDGVGWEVAMPKKWVKEWGPAILFSIYVLQAAVLAGRVVGIPLPPGPNAGVVKEALGLDSMFGSSAREDPNQANLSAILKLFAEITSNVMGSNLDLQSLRESFQQRSAITDEGKVSANLPIHLVGDAYKSIHKFLLTFGPLEEQLRGRMERVMAPDGDIEWVSMEGKDAWLKKHTAIVTQPLGSLPAPPTSPLPASTEAYPHGWLALRLTACGMAAEQVLVCERALVVKEGFATEASFAALPPAELHAHYLTGLGVTAKGTQMQLIALHRDLHAQHTTASAASPSISAAVDCVGLTRDEKARMLEIQEAVQSLTAELNKVRAVTASSSQQYQQGGKGVLVLKQAQCNVLNPHTKQPYTMDELVAEIVRLETLVALNAVDIAGVAAAAKEGLEQIVSGAFTAQGAFDNDLIAAPEERQGNR
jgi:hypothetical protein